jgi:hypothetical protein
MQGLRKIFSSFINQLKAKIWILSRGTILLGILLIIIVGIVFSLPGYQSPVRPSKTPPSSNAVSPTVQTPYTPTPTPVLPKIATDWTLNMPMNETKATEPLVEKNLLFATKKDTLVQVFKKDLQDGTQSTVFQYNEYAKANIQSGNLWESLSPSIALSPDKKLVAFSDIGGIKLYNLENKTEQTIIHATARPYPNKPDWSLHEMANVYSVAELSWTNDEKYLSFVQGFYEGSSYGVIDTQSKKYISDLGGGFGPSVPLTFSSRDFSFVIPQLYEGVRGLYIGNLETDVQGKNIAKIIDKENAYFDRASFSPDGSQIVFTYQEGQLNNDFSPATFNNLVTVNTGGTNFSLVM